MQQEYDLLIMRRMPSHLAGGLWCDDTSAEEAFWMATRMDAWSWSWWSYVDMDFTKNLTFWSPAIAERLNNSQSIMDLVEQMSGINGSIENTEFCDLFITFYQNWIAKKPLRAELRYVHWNFWIFKNSKKSKTYFSTGLFFNWFFFCLSLRGSKN